MKFGYLGNSGIELGELKFEVDSRDVGKQVLGYYNSGVYPMVGILERDSRLRLRNGIYGASHHIYAYRVLSKELPCIEEDYKTIKNNIT